MITLKRSLAILFLATLLSAHGSGGIDPVNKGKGNKAIHGYDPVAYFTDMKPVEGKQDYVFDWMGGKWFFVSSENLKLFAADPEKYAPQFGGYCAYAIGNNYTANGDPHAWSIVDNKLYLNYNKEVRKMWLKEIPELIRKGEKNWPQLLTK